MSQYRVGVIGCGWVGTNRHIPSYERDDRATLTAVYDHKLNKARKVANDRGIPYAHDDVEEFLDESLDLVSICTPPWTHPSLAVQTLESGANVLSEKPMAMSPAGAQRMVEAAERTGNKLGLVHNFLYADSMQKAKRKVASGAVGEIESVIGFQTSSPRRHLPTWYPDLPGGLFYDESPHLLYLMEEFLGELSVDEVSARYEPDEQQSLQMVNAGLVNDEGKLGTLTMLFNAPLSEWHLVVVGSEKLLVVDIFRDILIELDKEDAHDARDVLGVSLSAMAQETAGIVSAGTRMLQDDLLFGMGDLTAGYLDALDVDGTPPVSGVEGARIVDVMHEVLDGAGVDPTDAPKGPGAE